MIFLRYFILAFILICSTSIGYLIAKKFTDRLNELVQFSNLINILQNKIKFTKKPLAEIFEELSKIGEKNGVTEIFLETSKKLKIEKLNTAWEKAILKKAKKLDFNKEDIDIIKTLGQVLGKSDVEGQISELNQILTLISSQIKNAEIERNKNVKMYRSLGTIIGILIVIILF